VDRFKRINDAGGHAAGDYVLGEVAEVIRRSARQPELCGHIWGEEFVLFFLATPAAGAAAVAEQLRAAIAQTPIIYQTVSIPVSVSCSVAEKTPEMASPDDLLRSCDAMLYLAKEHGRNQTWFLDEAGCGVRAGTDGAGLVRVPPEQFINHPRVSPIRDQPRSAPVQCARENPAHKR
jgi:diguanylate cyclase (GGDEF)-like protein